MYANHGIVLRYSSGCWQEGSLSGASIVISSRNILLFKTSYVRQNKGQHVRKLYVGMFRGDTHIKGNGQMGHLQ